MNSLRVSVRGFRTLYRSCIEDSCHSSRSIADGECTQIISILQAIQAIVLIDSLLLNVPTCIFNSYSVWHIHDKHAGVNPCKTLDDISENDALQTWGSAYLIALYVKILTKLSRIPPSRP